MAYTVRVGTNFVVGYMYTVFFWALFMLYCIFYQLNKLRVYHIRKQRIAGNDTKVVTDLPGTKFFAKLDRVVRIPYCTEMISIKDIIGVSLFVFVNAIFSLFAPFSYVKGEEFVLAASGYMDRRVSFIGMANWGFVFFLAQRNSLLTMLCGWTVEELLPMHRIIARIGLLEFIPHFVLRIVQGYQRNGIPMEALFKDAEYTSGTISMFGFFLMFLTSFEYVRRNYFEVFYYCHIIFMIIGMAFGCWHETTCFVFMFPALGIWFFDRVYRSYNSWGLKTTNVRVDTVAPTTANQEGIVRVLFENGNMSRFKPGQYVYVIMAKSGRKFLKYANWHPYTISEIFRVKNNADGGVEERIIENAVNEKGGKGEKTAVESLDMVSMSDTSSLRRRANGLHSDGTSTVASFHLKALGKKTDGLLNYATANQEIKVIVDGPYGPHLDYQDYQVLALFGTGIGVTPALAVIKDVIERRCSGVRTVAVEHIYLTWAIKNTEEIIPFRDMFEYWTDRLKSSVQPLHLTVTVFITRMSEGPDVFESLPAFNIVYGQRPDVGVQMDKIKTVNAGRRVWSHACGSFIFTKNVINESIARGFHVHNETFEY
ncbi:uncharacterized protein EV154DRAFT_507637 [Mucor mucedo]|uniref:uncharacterized protein n=1 Tax=Mucor mucedo TaxID=29922 RepID=UPI00221F75D2|nr:uncharacterized protein EV154DRAFT_507637 [Mucor mucedo]KAI7891507.1 hypothetical protein EV154DRAFT_507637 [Mucor mucedo]